MICFNPKYVQYSYGPIYETKHFKKIIGQDKKGNPITVKIFYKTGKHRVGKIIKFITKKNFNPEAIGNGQTIIPCGKCLGCR